MQSNSSLALLRTEHDRLEQELHVGVVVYWLNTTVETELPRLGLDRVIFHYARLVPDTTSTTLSDAFMAKLVAALPDALSQLARLPLASMLVACTASGFTDTDVHHPDGVATAFDAIVSTLERLSAQRIVLITPYAHDMTMHEVESFNAAGIGVSEALSMGRSSDWASVTSDEIRGLVDRIEPAALRDADAVVLSCTGWRSLNLVPELEAAVGRPVLTSNIALATHAVCGHRTGNAPPSQRTAVPVT